MNVLDRVVGGIGSFERLVDFALDEAEMENLPIVLEHKQPLKINMKDVQKFIGEFRAATDLDVEFKIKTCLCCNELHAYMIIDYPDLGEMNEAERYPVQ